MTWPKLITVMALGFAGVWAVIDFRTGQAHPTAVTKDEIQSLVLNRLDRFEHKLDVVVERMAAIAARGLERPPDEE